MNMGAKSKDGRKAARGQPWLHLPGTVCEALYDTVIGARLACRFAALRARDAQFERSAETDVKEKAA